MQDVTRKRLFDGEFSAAAHVTPWPFAGTVAERA